MLRVGIEASEPQLLFDHLDIICRKFPCRRISIFAEFWSPKFFFDVEISLSGFTKKSIFLAFAECLQVSLDLENIFGSFENFRLLHSLCKVVEWVRRWQGVSATWIYHLQGGHLSISPAPSAPPSRWGKTNCVMPHICIFCFLQFKY